MKAVFWAEVGASALFLSSEGQRPIVLVLRDLAAELGLATNLFAEHAHRMAPLGKRHRVEETHKGPRHAVLEAGPPLGAGGLRQTALVRLIRFELEELAMFFFIGVAVAGQVFTAVFGRKLGSLLLSGAAGGVAWWLSASLLIAAGAAVAALVLVGLFGIGSVARRLGRGRSLPHVGGWSSGADSWNRGGSWGGGGGFSSGGGGDFGGGGASGDW
jgi:uncharacterized membrane protein YgcG